MERYAEVLRQLELIQYAIQHTYDAAHDECVLFSTQMPSKYYIDALKNLIEHRDAVKAQLDYIRQEEIIEDEVAQMALVSLRIDRLKEWMQNKE